MELDSLIDFVRYNAGNIITIVSVIVSVILYLRDRRIKHLRIDEMRLLHQMSLQLLGAIQGNNNEQKVLKNIKPESDTLDKSIYDVGLSEGYCQSLVNETAKNYCSLNNVSHKDIEEMIKQGRLDEKYKGIYLRFANKKCCIKRLFLRKNNN